MKIDSDLHIDGRLSCLNMDTLDAGSVSDREVAGAADIHVAKGIRLVKAGTNFGLSALANHATDQTYDFCVYVASAAATIRLFKAVILDLGTQDVAKQFVFDCFKGTAGSESLATILSGSISLDAADTDNTPVAGSLSTTAMAKGDMLEIRFATPDAIANAHGAFAWVEVAETVATTV